MQGLDLDSTDIFFIACSSRIIAALILTLKNIAFKYYLSRLLSFFGQPPKI